VGRRATHAAWPAQSRWVSRRRAADNRPGRDASDRESIGASRRIVMPALRDERSRLHSHNAWRGGRGGRARCTVRAVRGRGCRWWSEAAPRPWSGPPRGCWSSPAARGRRQPAAPHLWPAPAFSFDADARAHGRGGSGQAAAHGPRATASSPPSLASTGRPSTSASVCTSSGDRVPPPPARIGRAPAPAPVSASMASTCRGWWGVGTRHY
jgi:hypothetical protein